MSVGRGRLRRPRGQSLTNAFLVWLGEQDAEFRSEIIARKRRGRVNIRFVHFPTLSARVWRHSLGVYADDDVGEYFDQILDLDSLPIWIAGTQSFVCGFCEGERQEFDSREALWDDHLFEPFREWIVSKLRRATGVDYHRDGGLTFARLRMPDSSGPFVGDDVKIVWEGGAEHFRAFRRRRELSSKG